jgi:threonine/homoserine/homoserine lactone efflux protein
MLVVIVVLWVIVLGFVARDWASRWSRRRRWARARLAESAAPCILAQFGYEVLGAQVPGEYTGTSLLH